MGIIFNKRLASLFFFRICYYFCDVKAKLVNHIFDKRARKNKFCSLWGGSKQKTANSCIECQWAFKKDQAMLLYQITWKKCHTKRRNICSQNLRYHSTFIVIFFIQRSHKWSTYTMGLRIACIFVSKFMLLSWLYGAVILEVKRYRYTDPICAMRYRGTVFQFAIFWPLDY